MYKAHVLEDESQVIVQVVGADGRAGNLACALCEVKVRGEREGCRAEGTGLALKPRGKPRS